jgi:ribosomal protein L24E
MEAATPAEAELTQDPQCGAYFLKQQGVPAMVDGKPIHFCSEKCRDAYIERVQTD